MLQKEQTVKRRGGINELSLAFAGNYKERLMIGVSVGFPILNYTEEKLYNEADETHQKIKLLEEIGGEIWCFSGDVLIFDQDLSILVSFFLIFLVGTN